MLRTYRTSNPMVEFSKYVFKNKLLGGVTSYFCKEHAIGLRDGWPSGPIFCQGSLSQDDYRIL